MTSPNPSPGEGDWSYVNLMYHAFFKLMGDLFLPEWRQRGEDGERGRWDSGRGNSRRGGKEEGRGNSGQYIK